MRARSPFSTSRGSHAASGVVLNLQHGKTLELALRLLPETRRVVLVGGASQWDRDTMAFAKSEMARFAGRVEFLPLALPGWGTDQQVLALEREGLELDPDALLLCVSQNDVHEVLEPAEPNMPRPRFVQGPTGAWEFVPASLSDSRSRSSRWRDEIAEPLAACSALLSLLWTGGRLPRPQLDARTGELAWHSAPVGRKGRPPGQWQRLEASASAWLDPALALQPLLSRLARGAQQRGDSFLVTEIPSSVDLDLLDPRYAATNASETRESSPLATVLAEAGTLLGFEFVDVQPALWAAASHGEWLHVGDGHLNERGHELVADTLEPRLRSVLGL